MKKILTLVLVMAVSVMAVDFTGVDNGNGTVTISYNAPIVGMALNVDGAGVTVTGLTLPAFFDVFMDYAYVQGASYTYPVDTNGNPLPHNDSDAVALQGSAGVATLPSSSFCISAGGLEDNAGDTVPATGTIVLAYTGTGTITIDENSLRGGVVDYSGAMTTNLPIVINVGSVPSVCVGDIEVDGYITPDDINALVLFINATAPDYFAEVTPATLAYDVEVDGYITPDDINALVLLLNASAPDYFVACPE